jgi:hypothetical protein
MKTIYTTLPIYNKLAKQCYERGRHAGFDTPVPIVCPRHRLPSFQWLDDTDGAASVSRIDLMVEPDHSSQNITTWFTLPTMIPLAHDYFVYNGNTLNKLLTVGIWFLKITMDNGKVYWSDWFQVDCIYDNLISEFPVDQQDFDHFASSGTIISQAINDAGPAGCKSDAFSVVTGDVFKVLFYLTNNAGDLPKIYLLDPGVAIKSNQVDAVTGFNNITLTATDTGNWRLHFDNNNVADWLTTEIIIYRETQDNYLILNFHNDCDLGDIYYHGGFTQTLWFKSEPMESVFPLEESGITNGEGQVIRTFARQTKKYIVRTDKMPDYMVDVFNRMRLHDFIELIDLVGDTNTVYNLEVEHEWLAPDRYYAQINLTFDYDETVVIGGCCNNLL